MPPSSSNNDFAIVCYLHILFYFECPQNPSYICEKLTVTDICSAFALSRSALQSLFHEKKNCGVMDYFNHMKIERAKEIIRNGNMNFTEISYFLSYSSLQYFSKQFKKITGMSPMEYCSSVKGLSEAVNGDIVTPNIVK
ncbi:MAG TPA: helix-turn-helix transcriptional regulator [Candidatus Blautia stercoravium]|nr:helix-turn-helix transcriptional regulator [Candidatus Blautia stercoravium]